MNRPELAEWESAWAETGASTSLFRPALLVRPDVVVLAGYERGSIVAGAILNRAAQVVGLSNLFANAVDLDVAFGAAVAIAGERFPNEPIVGYETGDALAAARALGFVELGALRVWTKDAT